MTTAQKLQLRASEIRARLSEIAGLPDDGMTDEIRSEAEKLTTEYRDVEVRNRAAIVAEDAEREEAETRGGADGPDAETRALMDLQGRASFGRFMSGFAAGEQLTGAERELAEHRGLSTSGNVIPWDALMPAAPSVELRADAVTPGAASGNPVNQAAIVQRVFARGAVARLGVAMPSVGVGVASYPLIGTGQSAAFVAPDGTKEAAAGAIEPNRRAAYARRDWARPGPAWRVPVPRRRCATGAPAAATVPFSGRMGRRSRSGRLVVQVVHCRPAVNPHGNGARRVRRTCPLRDGSA